MKTWYKVDSKRPLRRFISMSRMGHFAAKIILYLEFETVGSNFHSNVIANDYSTIMTNFTYNKVEVGFKGPHFYQPAVDREPNYLWFISLNPSIFDRTAIYAFSKQ